MSENQDHSSETRQGRGVPYFPDHAILEVSVMALVVGVICFLATLMPMPVGDPADPLSTPAGIKPEWYFLTVFQILKYVPKTMGIIWTFLIFPPFMMLFPLFYNSVICKWKYGRLTLHTVGALGIITAIFFTMLAYLGFE